MNVNAQIAAAIERKLRTSPTQNEAFYCRLLGSNDDPAPIRVYLFADVLEELTFSSAHAGRSCVAVLTGGFGIEGEGGFIETTGFSGFDGVDLESAYDHIRETCDDFIHTAHENDDVIVGLFISDPGCDAVMNEAMARHHMSLFNVPFQPLVVLDPISKKVAIYIRPPKAKFDNTSFWVVQGVSNLSPKRTVDRSEEE